MQDLSMRDAFLDELYKIAKEDRRVILMSADFGAPALDKWRTDLPGQFLGVGIAEQNMISIAAGLALAGKLPFCFAIAPFLTMRCYEQIRVDLCVMNLPVTLVGVSGGYGYDDSGPTHHALEDIAVMRVLPNMTILSASDSAMATDFAQYSHKSEGPKYIRLDRERLPEIYESGVIEYTNDYLWIRWGREEGGIPNPDLVIIATGYMVHQALKIAHNLEGVATAVIDLCRIRSKTQLPDFGIKPIVTLEEHFLTGGIGSIVAESLADQGKHTPLKRFGIPNEYSFNYGGREELHRQFGLDVESVTKSIKEWLKELKG